MRFCLYAILGIALFGPSEMANLKAESEIQEPRNVASVTPHVISVVRSDARTGRLVRSIVVTPRAVPSKLIPEEKPYSSASPMLDADSGVGFLVKEAAKNFDVSPELVDSVIQVESNYNPYAISPKGAQGLMQLMPQTARRFGVKNT